MQVTYCGSAFSRRGLREAGEGKKVRIKKAAVSGGNWLQVGPMGSL